MFPYCARSVAPRILDIFFETKTISESIDVELSDSKIWILKVEVAT